MGKAGRRMQKHGNNVGNRKERRDRKGNRLASSLCSLRSVWFLQVAGADRISTDDVTFARQVCRSLIVLPRSRSPVPQHGISALLAQNERQP